MNTMARLFTLALAAVAYTGCGAGATGSDTMAGDDVNAEQARNAVVSCYAGSCDRKDPGAHGCEADATTVAFSDVSTTDGTVIGKIAIRYSAACRAAWARTSTSVPYYLRAELYRGGETTQSASPSAVTALRSQMFGVLTSGTVFKAVGYAGNFYDDRSFAKGSVSAPIW